MKQRAVHPINTGHLVMGLAFLGLAAVWLAVQTEAVPVDDVRWLLPLPWLFAGAAGLIAFAVARTRRTPPSVGTYDAGPDEDATETPGEPEAR